MRTDLEIKQDVLDELKWQPNIDETQIGVIVEEGAVTLTGFVDEFSKKMTAENAAKRVAGVKALAEDIVVKYGDNYNTTDKEIAKAAVSELEWNASVPEEKVMVKVKHGYIFLTGDLEWEYQKNAAKRSVQNLQGVKGVINNFRIQQKVAPIEVKTKIAKVFERSADIDSNNIEIEVHGNTVTLQGTVNSLKEKDDAERGAFCALGVTDVKNELKVEYNSIYI